MPEGPSIVILKEEASRFIGKKVLKVSGNSKLDIQSLKGKTITDMKTWGKHFLICFKGLTVRIHLMMFGSYRINEKKETPPRLSLQFKDGELNLYTCAVKFIEGDLDEVYDWQVDIMSPRWKAAKAVAAIKNAGKTLVCDIMLDQQIFSGSGNIFKNEVLFNTRIHPLSTADALPAAKVKELVKETRDYAFKFLKWKKKFVLKKHWLAHTKKICPRCDIPFVLNHLGKGKRRSFYCENCQVLYTKKAAATPKRVLQTKKRKGKVNMER